MPVNGTPHNEIAQGGLAVLYGATQMPATMMDPLGVNTAASAGSTGPTARWQNASLLEQPT